MDFDFDAEVRRPLLTIELRSWNPETIPRIRHIGSEATWETLHEVAFTTFNRDPQQYTVHFYRDSFRDASTSGKPRIVGALWTAGIYHGIALRIRGDHKFVVYAHFEQKV